MTRSTNTVNGTTSSGVSSQKAWRVSGVGQTKLHRGVKPCCTRSLAMPPMRRACLTRPSSEKSTSCQNARTASPSITVTGTLRAWRDRSRARARVVLPAPGKPMIRILRGFTVAPPQVQHVHDVVAFLVGHILVHHHHAGPAAIGGMFPSLALQLVTNILRARQIDMGVRHCRRDPG